MLLKGSKTCGAKCMEVRKSTAFDTCTLQLNATYKEDEGHRFILKNISVFHQASSFRDVVDLYMVCAVKSIIASSKVLTNSNRISSSQRTLHGSNYLLCQQLRIRWESRTEIIILLILNNESVRSQQNCHSATHSVDFTDSSQGCSCTASRDHPRPSAPKPRHHHSQPHTSCNNPPRKPSSPKTQPAQT